MAYTKLSKDEFEEFLDELELDFKFREDVVSTFDFSEYVYSAAIDKGFYLVIYSSISINTGKVRAKGNDAIHLKIHHNQLSISDPVSSEPKTLRTENWDKNLRKKIQNAVKKVQEAPMCGDCDGYLIRRDGKYGEFFGCINYPGCKNTE